MAAGIDHVKLRVASLDDALPFYTDVMGFVEVHRSDDCVFLSCGVETDGFDLSVTEGGTGIDHLAVQGTADELDAVERRLTERDIETNTPDRTEPGVEDGVRVSLPSGVDVEFVANTPDRYAHVVDTADSNRSPITPTDVNHVNLVAQNIRTNVEFVESALGFETSEIEKTDEDGWKIAFTRSSDTHHDVGFTSGPAEYSLKHVAWSLPNIEQMKMFIDEITRAGYELEIGISRHRAGNNLFAYFWEPGGNRFEITTEMATVEPGTEPIVREPDDPSTFTAWGGVAFPESLQDGS